MADLSVDIRARAGDFILEAAFEAGPGITAIFGRSGAGKSTLLRAVAGLLRPERASVTVGGQILEDSATAIRVPARARRAGFVFQDDRLFPHMSVRRNMAYGARGGSASDFDQVTKLLGLADLLDRMPATLSGGERKRVAIARALLSGPRILLMDEPLASLDHARRELIMPYLERIRAETTVPILYVSHEVDEVARLADTLVLLSAGRVVEHGRAADLFTRLDLAPLLGRSDAGALLEGTVCRHDPEWGIIHVEVEGHTLRLPAPADSASIAAPGAVLRMRARARDVDISLGPLEGLSVPNQLPMIIDAIRQDQSGTFAEIRGRIGAQYLRARVFRQAVAELGLAEGMTVYALIERISFDRRLVQEHD